MGNVSLSKRFSLVASWHSDKWCSACNAGVPVQCLTLLLRCLMGIYLELLTRGFLVELKTAFVLPISEKPFPKITAGEFLSQSNTPTVCVLLPCHGTELY